MEEAVSKTRVTEQVHLQTSAGAVHPVFGEG
jgi:hypothetical protein